MSRMNDLLIVCAEYYEHEKKMSFDEAMEYTMKQKLDVLVDIYNKEISKRE